ncbi:MAG: hypothetical protein KBF45_05530 [Cyclobacteriaceae bacterium]|jgi:hypothetical protein|nr:hypothetical protein [Cyclobacteriaceae bacterium]
MKFIHYFNFRTLLALVISQAATYIAITNDLSFHLDLLLFGICIVFPLHFSMQSAFKRRDRALEYFSLFKGGSMSLYYSFQIAEDLPPEKKKEATRFLKSMVDQLMQQLEHRISGYNNLQQKLNEIFSFIETYRDEISKRNTLRMIRYLRDVTESSAYLLSLVNHRTMAGLRFYSIFFIIIFPMVQAPIMLSLLQEIMPVWLIYIFLGTTSFILVTLNNFQTMIEYPFDKNGMDSIAIRDFSLDIPA